MEKQNVSAPQRKRREDAQNGSLRELLPHGTAMLPLMVHDMETDPRFPERVSCHWHDEIEFLVVTKGQAVVHVDQSSWEANTGDVIFVRPNRLHSASAETGADFSFFAVVFSPVFISSFVSDRIQQKDIDPVLSGRLQVPVRIDGTNGWGSSVREALEKIRLQFQSGGPGAELLLKAELFRIWYELIRHASGEAEDSRKSEQAALIRSILIWLRENYSEPVVLSELAERFHVSEGHMCRVFRSVTRMSVIEYLNSCRIAAATGMLRESGKDIGGIAAEAGYNNISYFNRQFRKYMHLTPTQFRNGEDKKTAGNAALESGHFLLADSVR